MKLKVSSALLLGPLALLGCVTNPDKPLPVAMVEMEALSGNPVRGRMTFGELQGVTRIFVDLTGLTGEHGFHVHEEGDCRRALANLKKGHFNPDGKPHGQHMGDLANLRADVYGTLRAPMFARHVDLRGPNSIVGRTVIVTSHPDDFQTQPDGGSGQAIACGVIMPV
jgi:Cu-Zn family superoxide dismutase